MTPLHSARRATTRDFVGYVIAIFAVAFALWLLFHSVGRALNSAPSCYPAANGRRVEPSLNRRALAAVFGVPA